MPSSRDIKRRIQSVKSTQQITKAMKMVSAAKLYKSQRSVLASKPYSKQLLRLFAKLSRISDGKTQIKLLEQREIKKTAIVLVTGNRGLAGGFNHTLIKLALAQGDDNCEYIAVGSRGRDALLSAGRTVANSFCEIRDIVAFSDVEQIGELIVSSYESEKYDCIKVVYQKFISPGKQEPFVMTLLPISVDEILSEEQDTAENSGQSAEEYIFEGDQQEILETLSKKYVYNSIMQAVLESKTGEHIARMIAMNSATDNASEMIKQLQMDYNRSRQTAVTREIAEISGSANAVM
ncbi:MAG: ATP synthase F1 subunit gamma [Oscillospiraceae bacterium]